jgi:hypothetical protein
MKIYIGIDPGKQGAIAIQKEGQEPIIHKIPLVVKEYDIQNLKNIFIQYCSIEDEVMVGIENVHALFGSSAKNTFEFGFGLGLLEAIVSTYEIPYVKINPKEWQKLAFEGIPAIYKIAEKKDNTKNTKLDTKAMAVLAVKRLYPKQPLNYGGRAEKPNEGLCDALLISHYLKYKY